MPIDTAPGAAADDKKEALSGPTIGEVREALQDFLILADRCLTTPQRGFTPLTRKEFKLFEDIAAKLNSIRDAEPQHGSRKKRRFTVEQLRIGEVRDGFDWLCNSARRQVMTRKRDDVLTAALYDEFVVRMPELEATPKIVADAVSVVRDRAALVSEADDDELGDPVERHDWLVPRSGEDALPGTSEKRREQANDVAGDILEEVLARCPVAVSCKTSRGSTESYASRFRKNVPATQARAVSRNEPLTLLATLLGVPLRDAPWTAFRIRLLLQGGDLPDLANPEWRDSWDLRDPTEFKLLETEEWREMRASFEQQLVAAGRPDDGETLRFSFRLAASHLGRAGRYARTQIPVGEEGARPVDPFDSDRAVRTSADQLMRLLGSGGGFVMADGNDLMEWMAGTLPDVPVQTPNLVRTPVQVFPFDLDRQLESRKAARRKPRKRPSDQRK
jgi:hypothetical protein